jgi:hypothetical protein
MKLVNLTPHTLNIHTDNGVESIEPSGQVARVDSESTPAEPIGNIPTFHVEFGEVTDLPEPQEDVVYIVSGMVSDAISRRDVLSPGQLVRDENGRPIGCKGLRRHSNRIRDAVNAAFNEGAREGAGNWPC